MKVYYHVDFTGHYPVGAAAVVVAKSRRGAARLLNDALRDSGLKQDVDYRDFRELKTDKMTAIILVDGNY